MVLEFELENVFIKICSDRGDMTRLRKNVQGYMQCEMVKIELGVVVVPPAL
jgi:hypothetical protein